MNIYSPFLILFSNVPLHVHFQLHVNLRTNQPHGSIISIKFSPCTTNPCVTTEPRTHLCAHADHERSSRAPAEPRASRAERHEPRSRAVHNERPSRAPAEPSVANRGPRTNRAPNRAVHSAVRTQPRAQPSRALDRVRRQPSRELGRVVRSNTQSCSSHLEHSVLYTL